MTDLRRDLERAPHAFTLLAAVSAAGDGVRLRPALSLAFPRAEVLAAERNADDAWRLTVGLPGLYGTGSPLPASYTEDLFADGDDELRRGVLDLVNHRVLSLLVDTLRHRRDGTRRARQLALATGLDGRLVGGRIPGEELLAYAGFLAGRCRSADALERILTHRSDVPCAVEECVERWTGIPIEQRTSLGLANATLGQDTIAGESLCSRATAFRIVVGPLPWDRVDPWLPGGDGLADLCALTDLANGDGLDYEIELLVETAGMPCQALGAGRLGLDSRTDGMPADLRRELVHRSA